MMLRIALLAVLLVASSAAGFYLYQQVYGPTARPVEVPTPPAPEPAAAVPVELLPSFSLPDMDGNPRSVDEWRGRPLLINFWATWCPPCREEMPLLIDLQNEFESIDLQVIGIAVDEPAPVRRFAEQIGVNYPLLVGEQESIDVAEALGLDVFALPITVLANAAGEIVSVHMGELHRDEALALLDQL